MRDVAIIGAARTPIGRFGGKLKDIGCVGLGAAAIAEAVKRAGVKPEKVDEVIMGNVLSAGAGQNPARQAAVEAGIPCNAVSMTVNKVCGSGMKAITLAALSVRSGESDISVAGGMESMSNAPFLLSGARWGYRLGDGKITDSILNDGLRDAFNDCHMAELVEDMAVQYGISRRQQDIFALDSQAKAARAWQSGLFEEEIAPFFDRKGNLLLDRDEFPRPDTTLEKLAELKTPFRKGGTITAGNASGINDGAAAAVVVPLDMAKELREPALKARIVSHASSGVDPACMGIGPVDAVRKALVQANLSICDIELVELNEAFSAQALIVIRELGLDESVVNPSGGAVALGHPIGASGARIIVTLLYGLKREKKRFGLAALCIGGGMGMAVIVELI